MLISESIYLLYQGEDDGYYDEGCNDETYEGKFLQVKLLQYLQKTTQVIEEFLENNKTELREEDIVKFSDILNKSNVEYCQILVNPQDLVYL